MCGGGRLKDLITVLPESGKFGSEKTGMLVVCCRRGLGLLTGMAAGSSRGKEILADACHRASQLHSVMPSLPPEGESTSLFSTPAYLLHLSLCPPSSYSTTPLSLSLSLFRSLSFFLSVPLSLALLALSISLHLSPSPPLSFLSL